MTINRKENYYFKKIVDINALKRKNGKIVSFDFTNTCVVVFFFRQNCTFYYSCMSINNVHFPASFSSLLLHVYLNIYIIIQLIT